MSNHCSFGRISEVGFKTLCQNGRIIIDKDLNGTFQKVSPKESENGVYIEKPVMNDRIGIGRISLGDSVIIPSLNSVILDGSYWDLNWNTSPTLSGNVDMLTVPDEFHPCAQPNSMILLDIKVTLKTILNNFLDEIDHVCLEVLKNGSVVSSSFSALHDIHGGTTPHSIFLHDVVSCSPGDTLNVQFINHSQVGSVELLGDASGSHLNYRILSFQPQSNI